MFTAQNLKNIRKRKGLSQEEMAQKLKLNRSTYSGYENEVAQPNLETLLYLAQEEKLPLESLLTTDLSKLSNADYEALCGAWKQGASGQFTIRLLDVFRLQHGTMLISQCLLRPITLDPLELLHLGGVS